MMYKFLERKTVSGLKETSFRLELYLSWLET